jgi:hypothetical protein
MDSNLSFLGSSFVKADGSTVDLEYVCKGKVIIILYSASWYVIRL